MHRANGVLLARGSAPDRWKDAQHGFNTDYGVVRCFAFSLLKSAWLILDLRQEHFVKALESFPSNSNALFLLGMGALEMGFLENAVELMNKSLLLDPDFRAPYVPLGSDR